MQETTPLLSQSRIQNNQIPWVSRHTIWQTKCINWFKQPSWNNTGHSLTSEALPVPLFPWNKWPVPPKQNLYFLSSPVPLIFGSLFPEKYALVPLFPKTSGRASQACSGPNYTSTNFGHPNIQHNSGIVMIRLFRILIYICICYMWRYTHN